MRTVEVNGKEYKVIKKYKYYTLCEDINGIKTCFDDFDLGIRPVFYYRGKIIKDNELYQQNRKMS